MQQNSTTPVQICTASITASMSSPLHHHAPSRIAHNYGLQSSIVSAAAPISPGAAAARPHLQSSSPGLMLRDHHAAPVSPSAQARAHTMVGHLTGSAGSSSSNSYAALGSSYDRAFAPNASPMGSPVSYAMSASPPPASAAAAAGKSPKQSRPALLAPMWTAATAASSAPASPSAATAVAAAAPAASSTPLPYSTPVPVSAADPHLLIRRACSSDYSKGHVALLSQLTTVGAISAADYTARSRLMERHGELLHCLVIEDVSCVPAGEIVASATLILEPKFVHACGWVGHIEDVVVSSRCRGKNLGHRILAALHEVARRAGCYKVLLDCADANRAFYEKIGYVEKEKHMRLDL